jgi:hypothetical protein
MVVIFAPILGYVADHYGVGLALAAFGVGASLFYLFARVQEHSQREVESA